MKIPKEAIRAALAVERHAPFTLHDHMRNVLAAAWPHLVAGNDYGNFRRGIDAAVAWHEGQIADLENRIKENDAVCLAEGEPAGMACDANVHCAHSINVHRGSIAALCQMAPKDGRVGPDPIKLTYTNYRGETSERLILPKGVWFGATKWHPEPQWLLHALDCEKQAVRDFALSDFGHGDYRRGLEDADANDIDALISKYATAAIKYQGDGLPNYVWHLHFREFAAAIRALSPDSQPAPVAAFGTGKLVVDTGTWAGTPAVFIGPAKIGGVVGEKVLPEDGLPLRSLSAGEWFMTFPTDTQAKAVADALCNQVSGPLSPAHWDIEEYKIWKGINPDKACWSSLGFACPSNGAASSLMVTLYNADPTRMLRVVPLADSQPAPDSVEVTPSSGDVFVDLGSKTIEREALCPSCRGAGVFNETGFYCENCHGSAVTIGQPAPALPSAWMVRENDHDGWDFVRLKKAADQLIARGFEVVPLYTAPVGQPAPAEPEWLPIESAPRDGTEVDLYVRPYNGKARRVIDCWWTDITGWRDAKGKLDKGFRITHWSPLPSAPAGGGE